MTIADGRLIAHAAAGGVSRSGVIKQTSPHFSWTAVNLWRPVFSRSSALAAASSRRRCSAACVFCSTATCWWDADGGYILGGYSASKISGDKTENTRGREDYWIIKTDANGVKQWDKTLGGNGYDQLNLLQQTADGGYILGGYSESGISGDKTEARGLKDYWIVKLSSDVLPVTFLSFTAIKTEHTVSLSWQTASEQNNSYFSVQRSSNGSDFADIEKVPAKGSSMQVQQYSFEDIKPLSGNNYYRLKQVDANGRFTYTKIAFVDFNTLLAIKLFPNPAQKFLTVKYYSNTEGSVQVSMFDAAGKQVLKKTERAIKGSNTYQLDVSQLSNGIYTLQLNNREKKQIRFAIQR